MSVPETELAGLAVRVGIGELLLGGVDSSMRATLGSCVGTCIVWSREEVFGLSHVLLPYPKEALDQVDDPARYASTAIPHMIELMEVPRRKRRELVAYIAGGSSMFNGSGQQTHVGEQNQIALRETLKANRVRVKCADLGGEAGRQIVVHGPTRMVFSMHLSTELIKRWPMPKRMTPGSSYDPE